ncbi:hypothetical protein KBA63_00240 [Candidatus Woesebacteria bacterium]|nr:hypothetical protein [Candidatus Woesebacteria bacterium]
MGNSEKGQRAYWVSIPLETRASLKRLVYGEVDQDWYKIEERRKDSRKVRGKLCMLCRKYKVLDKPQFLPVVALKLKVFIKESCPTYVPRLI